MLLELGLELLEGAVELAPARSGVLRRAVVAGELPDAPQVVHLVAVLADAGADNDVGMLSIWVAVL